MVSHTKEEKMIRNIICPRCYGKVPSNDNPGAYIGALSRTDNNTEICSRCGELEALEDLMWGSPLSQMDWNINQ